MRTSSPALILLLLLAVGSGRLAAEGSQTPAPESAALSAIFAGPDGQMAAPKYGLEKAPSTPARPMRPRWASTGGECPPSNLRCVYYASGDCLWCGFGMTQWCDSYTCSDGALYTCCTCDFNVC